MKSKWSVLFHKGSIQCKQEQFCWRKQYTSLHLVLLLSGIYLRTDSRIAYIYFYMHIHRATITLPPVISICTLAPEPIPPVPVCLFLLHTVRSEFLSMDRWPGATEAHIPAQESTSADNELHKQEYFAQLQFQRSVRGAGIYWHLHWDHILDFSMVYTVP